MQLKFVFTAFILTVNHLGGRISFCPFLEAAVWIHLQGNLEGVECNTYDKINQIKSEDIMKKGGILLYNMAILEFNTQAQLDKCFFL